jgi:hypothetical protein
MADIDDMALLAKLFGTEAADVRAGLAPEVNDLIDEVAAEVLQRYLLEQPASDIFSAIRGMEESMAARCGRELASECRAVIRARLRYMEHERRRLDTELTDLIAEIAMLESIRNHRGGTTE